ncbi:uncharacterized protein APUU_21891A [Aspergillus puulaauensis]|uniref:Uncharacterized protein n=1 Tax=Aspergillus puulaauensis TaxID=1220207 RepID=A0A7R8AJ72_9EURO|nr:uncharacterized protein APUU_21891A [Aspergillus puulaauensis]BCS21459.1 hypothetical protein APUU_21891A [Aspergillus puulaauensis]
MNREVVTVYTLPVAAFATISISLTLRSEMQDSTVLATKVEPSQTGTLAPDPAVDPMLHGGRLSPSARLAVGAVDFLTAVGSLIPVLPSFQHQSHRLTLLLACWLAGWQTQHTPAVSEWGQAMLRLHPAQFLVPAWPGAWNRWNARLIVRLRC